MSDQLTIQQDQALMPMTFSGLMAQAEVIFKSGLLPKSVRSPAAAVAIMLTGRELGITPMQSFRSIYVVDGTPTLSAQFIAAKLLESGVTYDVSEMTNERCTIEFARGNGMTLTYTYTWQDATNADLAGKRNWRQYPKDMLWSRCMTLGGRKIAPDALLGFHTADELGAIVEPQTGDVMNSGVREIPPREAISSSEEPDSEPLETTQSEEPEPTAKRRIPSNLLPGAIQTVGRKYEPVATEAETSKPHWIEDERVRKRFWAWTTNMALSNNEVHEALGVEHVADYQGSMQEAKDQLIAYVNKMAAEEPELAADGVPSEEIPI